MGSVYFLLLASVSPLVKWAVRSGVAGFCDLCPLVSSPLLVKIGVTGNEGEGERREEGNRMGGKTDGSPKTTKGGVR